MVPIDTEYPLLVLFATIVAIHDRQHAGVYVIDFHYGEVEANIVFPVSGRERCCSYCVSSVFLYNSFDYLSPHKRREVSFYFSVFF